MPIRQAGETAIQPLSGAAVIPKPRRANSQGPGPKRPGVVVAASGFRSQSPVANWMRPPGGEQPFGLLRNGLKAVEANRDGSRISFDQLGSHSEAVSPPWAGLRVPNPLLV